MAKNTELFSQQDPDTLFSAMMECAKKQGIICNPSDLKYKVKMEVPTPDGSKVGITVELLNCGEEKICVEFVKTFGDYLQFYDSFNTFKKYFGC